MMIDIESEIDRLNFDAKELMKKKRFSYATLILVAVMVYAASPGFLGEIDWTVFWILICTVFIVSVIIEKANEILIGMISLRLSELIFMKHTNR